MDSSGKWIDGALTLAEHLPFIRRLGEKSRQKAAAGALIVGLFLLFVGGMFGAANRGVVGTFIGAASGIILGVILGGAIGALAAVFAPESQARAVLAIELDKGDGHFLPGDCVSGHVSLLAHNRFRANGGKIYFMSRGLFAHNEPSADDGNPEVVRESRQYLLRQADVIPDGKLRKGALVRYPFSFDVPQEGLPTHHGYACSVRWVLHAVLDAPGGEPIRAQQEIYVETAQTVFAAQPAGFQSIVSSGDAQITLSLPRVVCSEGEQVRADVRVSPLQSFDASEVRAVLLRIENTSEGDDHVIYVGQWDADSGRFRGERRPGGRGTTYVWLERETSLAGPMMFDIAESRYWQVALDIPAQWRPTLVSKDGRVTWKLGLIIAREGQDDLRAFHEVIVQTGAPNLGEMFAPDDGGSQ